MSFTTPNEDQLAMVRGVSEFLACTYPRERFRTPGNADDALWHELAALGILGISLPEAAGGLGMSWVEEAFACREAGRQLLSPALVGSIIALHIAARNGQTELRNDLLRGARWAGVAVTASTSSLNIIDGSDGLAVLCGQGEVRLVEYADGASTAHCIDESVRMVRLTANSTDILIANDAELALATQLLVAAMLCGVLETVLEMAAGYARIRTQFGRPIGAFQAIKHRCADIALAAELCWSQTLQAATALATRAEDSRFHVATARLLAGEEALKAARVNIQIHGGMGITDEVDAHRLLKRAHVLQQLCGDPRLLPAALISLPLNL
jgi:alkylation response protein AidB-like acyl-CoA dehydrogenase